MAVEDIIARGVGFSPNGVIFIVTHGLAPVAATQSNSSANSPGALYGMDRNGRYVQRPSVPLRPRPGWWFD